MTQEVFPEIQAATVALEKRIASTEGEITEMQNTIAAKKSLIRGWRKAVMAVKPGTLTAKAVAVGQAPEEEFADF